MVKKWSFLIFSPLFFQYQILLAEENSNSNFIVISNSSNSKSHNDYRMPSENFENVFANTLKLLKSKNPNLSLLLLFYTEDCPDDQISSRMFVLDKDKLYIYSKERAINLLGKFIDPSDKIIIPFKNSVSKGKLVAAYWGKKHSPTSIIVDESGFVYSVSQETSNGFSIKTLGVSSTALPNQK